MLIKQVKPPPPPPPPLTYTLHDSLAIQKHYLLPLLLWFKFAYLVQQNRKYKATTDTQTNKDEMRFNIRKEAGRQESRVE